MLECEGETVSTEGGVVTLDLEQIVLEAADRIGLRSRSRTRFPTDVGASRSCARTSSTRRRTASSLLKTLAWVLPLLALVAFALGRLAAGDRRRAMRRIGVTVLVVGWSASLRSNVVGNYVVDSLVAETENRTAAGSAWDILTELLRSSFRWLVAVGVLFLVAAWLAGPGRRAVAVRRVLAPALRERVWAYAALGSLHVASCSSPAPQATSRDISSCSPSSSLGAAWIEQMRTQTLREFPDASGSELLADARSRATAGGRRACSGWGACSAPAPPGGHRTPASRQLADLHARGELTDEEFASAKARALAGD